MRKSPSSRVFYGWIVLSGLSLTQTVSWGILYYGFGVLLPAMQAEFGWSRTQLSGAFSAGLLASAAAAIPVVRHIDRRGARAVMTAGSCLAALLLVAWSQVESLWAFYAIWIGLGFAMSAVLYEPAFAVLVTWFVRRRTEALSLLTSVAGFASTIFVPIITWLIVRTSWRTALLLLAAVLAITTIPAHAFVLRSRPGDVGLGPDGDRYDQHQEADRRAILPDVSTSPARVGWFLAAIVVATMGAAQVPGRIVFTWLTRQMSARWSRHWRSITGAKRCAASGRQAPEIPKHSSELHVAGSLRPNVKYVRAVFVTDSVDPLGCLLAREYHN